VPRRGNESTHTTAESPIGSPQAQRASLLANALHDVRSTNSGCSSYGTGNLSTHCQSLVGSSWPSASVDMLPSPAPTTFSPALVPSLPHFASGLPASSATTAPTTGLAPTATTKPPSPTALPSFQAPFLMVEDLKVSSPGLLLPHCCWGRTRIDTMHFSHSQGQFKTMYKEFPFDTYGCSTVPFLNLDAPPGCSPFLDSETIKKHKVSLAFPSGSLWALLTPRCSNRKCNDSTNRS
jgi:hypothetical protein